MGGHKTFPRLWLLGCPYFLVPGPSFGKCLSIWFLFYGQCVGGWLSWVELGALGLLFTCLYKLCMFGWGFALISLDCGRNRFARHFMKCKIERESDGADQKVGTVVKVVSSNGTVLESEKGNLGDHTSGIGVVGSINAVFFSHCTFFW